ncbi:MAG: PBECR2 nuclease fold domain-containing protein [Bdellovibrionia bacterium]
MRSSLSARKKSSKAQLSSSSSSREAQSTGSSVREMCEHCTLDLSNSQRALFVEEEVGRVFCSETCIAAYFTPEINRLEKDYLRKLSPSDLSASEKEKLAHLRWVTLEDPDEVWCEKTISGDLRYTLIAEFAPEQKKIWSICICLCLRGEPSFLFLAFQTRNSAMLSSYRKGERITWSQARGKSQQSADQRSALNSTNSAPVLTDGLDEPWTPEETLRAQIVHKRHADDIPMADFGLYESCLDETLESPDEVWSLVASEFDPYEVYHFIRYYSEDSVGFWFVIIARETEDAGQIEIIEAFPTRDSSLVDRHRKGHQEIGQTEEIPLVRVVH